MSGLGADRTGHDPAALGPEGPVAVVTGAARGIGAATVASLVGSGWRVVAVDRCADDPALEYPLAAPEDLDELVARHGACVAPLEGDVRRQADMDAAVDLALASFGRLDAAVAVAGVISGGPPLWAMDDERWNVLFDVNVLGVRRLATAAVPRLLDAPPPRSGRVVAVASAAGMLGLRRLAAYSASKHAVIGLVKGLAADLAGTGVTANAVCPGSTRTALLRESARIYGMSSPEEFAGQQLLERLLAPEEPAALVAWLCGGASSAVTGAALPADGGMTTF
jgi:SDR family mycofactocin-dependent oxidoreductase